MLKDEDIECWNDIFADGKIQESDIKNPTIAFLVKTLVAYLKKFGYKIDSPSVVNNTDNSREKRLFLIRLVQHIDRILKHTDKSFSFLYYDLLRPVSKKISHTFGILLNSYFYYEMFRKDVFDLANDRIKSHEDLLKLIENTKQANEERKQRAEKINEEIEDLSQKVPTADAELEVMLERKRQQEEDLQKIQVELKELNQKYMDLQAQERYLKNQVVEDNKAEQLKQEIIDLQKKITERQAQQHDMEKDQRNRLERICQLETLKKCLGNCKDLLPSKLVEHYKDLKKKLKQSETLHSGMIHQRQVLSDKLTKQLEELKSIEEKHRSREKQLYDDHLARSKIITEINNVIESKTMELKKLKDKLNRINFDISEQKEMQNYLSYTISQLLLDIRASTK